MAVATPLGGATSAQATYAEGGSGLYKGSIDWFEWSDTPNQTIPAEGMSVSNTRIIAGQPIVTECSLSNIDGVLRTYRPGFYPGDALDDLYNVGGVHNDNEMIVGLANQIGGSEVSFDVNCSATLDGEVIPLQGLVFGDSEISTAPQGEFIHAIPFEEATWRIIDRHRSDSCTTATQAIVGSDSSLRFAPDGRQCHVDDTGEGPMAIGFMQGATGARMTVKGGGISALALGVVLQADFGDAPSSYGEAGALFEPTWSGGEVGVGTTPVSGDDFELGRPGQPVTRLGATVDADSGYFASADATGDDLDGNRPSDEDAITSPGTAHVTPGGTYELNDVACTGPGHVGGWIDWNRNGAFDAGESADPVECSGTDVDLRWDVPTDAATGPSFMRLRIAQGQGEVSSPIGMTTSGEVEDYALDVQLPVLSLEKSNDATAATRVGDTVTYTVTATNAGKTAFTEDFPAVVLDDLSAVLDDAVYNGDVVASRPGTLSYEAPLIAWTGSLDAGESVSLTYTTTLRAGGDGVVKNTAWAPEDPTDPVTPACEGEDDVPCAITEFMLPALTVSKTADVTEVSADGESVDYTVTVTNVGPGDFTSDAPASFVDDLSDVLDDAEFDGQATASVGTVAYEAPELSWSGPLASGESAVITYTVSYTGAGDTSLDNTVCIPAIDTAVDSDSCAVVTVPGARLSQWKTVESSDTPAVAGTVLTYTLHFENDGKAPAAVDAEDTLVRVLDDADVTTEPVGSGGVDATRTGDVIAISGSVEPGSVATVSYAVTVKEDGERGDDRLVNHLLKTGQDIPDRCESPDPERPTCTVNHVGDVVVTKMSDPESGSEVAAGHEVTYTLTFENTSASDEADPVAVDYTDHMSGVLDDATLVDGPHAAGSLTAVRTGSEIRVTGMVASGETLRVTYTVKVNPGAELGDSVLRNVVAATGAEPVCLEGAQTCTEHPVTPEVPTETVTPPGGLATTGGAVSPWLWAMGLLVPLGAGLILASRKRRSRAEGADASMS